MQSQNLKPASRTFLCRVINIRRGVESGNHAMCRSSHVQDVKEVRRLGLMVTMSSMGVGLGRNRLELGHRHDGQEANKEEEQDGEYPEGPEEGEDFHDRRTVVTPAGRKEVTSQRGDDDHETLEPHAHVDKDGKNPNERGIFANLLKPEKLRRDYVARNHDPVGPSKGTERTVDERKALVGVGAIPGDEELHARKRSPPSCRWPK